MADKNSENVQKRENIEALYERLKTDGIYIDSKYMSHEIFDIRIFITGTKHPVRVSRCK